MFRESLVFKQVFVPSLITDIPAVWTCLLLIAYAVGEVEIPDGSHLERLSVLPRDEYAAAEGSVYVLREFLNPA